MSAARSQPPPSVDVEELLGRAGQLEAQEMQRRFEELNEKRKADALSADELEELWCLTDKFEQADAERVECLSKLARLRNVSLSALMAELGLRSPHYA